MSTEEALNGALDEVEHLVEALELPDEVGEFAKMVVQQWAEMNRLESRPIAINAAAAVVVACKNQSLPFTTRDVAAHLSQDVDPEELTGSDEEVKNVAKYIGRAETDMITTLKLEASVATPEDYVDRFCDELGLDEAVAERTQAVLEAAQEGRPNLFSGRSPSAGAAAAIWIGARLGDKQITQEAVANVGETSTVTIRDMANSIIIGVFESDTEIEAMKTTEEMDARLNQRIEKSRQQLEA